MYNGEELDLFEMANLFPATTGLPMTVWVSPRGRAQHDARVKVHMTHGNRMDISNTAEVGIRPSAHLISGGLTTADNQAVFDWVQRNTDALIDYWDGNIDTAQLIGRLVKV
jgi:hypothetical protein